MHVLTNAINEIDFGGLGEFTECHRYQYLISGVATPKTPRWTQYTPCEKNVEFDFVDCRRK